MIRQLGIWYILIALLCNSCTSSTTATDEEGEDRNLENAYSEQTESTAYYDGEHCATIDYYNPNTGTRSTYTLTVLVEDGELVQINWPSGGWLDESHFSPETLDEDGSCSFTTSEGREYSVQIDSEGSCGYSSSSIDEEEPDEEIYTEEEEEELEIESTEEEEIIY